MNELNARATVGRTSLSVPRVGIETAPLGNMFSRPHRSRGRRRPRQRRRAWTPLLRHGAALRARPGQQPVGRAVAPLLRDGERSSRPRSAGSPGPMPTRREPVLPGRPALEDTAGWTAVGLLVRRDHDLGRGELPADRARSVRRPPPPRPHDGRSEHDRYRALADLRSSGTVKAGSHHLAGPRPARGGMRPRHPARCRALHALRPGGDGRAAPCEERTVSILVVGGVFLAGS